VLADFDASALLALAQRHFAAARFEEAETACHDVIAHLPDEPNALLLLAAIAAAQQRWHEAATFLLFGRTRHPQQVTFHRALADLFLGLGDLANAVEPLESCVLVEPNERDHRGRLLALYETCRFTTFRQSSRQAMLACLSDEELSHEKMQRAWLSLLRQDTEAQSLLLVLTSPNYEAFERSVSPELLSSLQDNELFTLGLTRLLVMDLAIERGLGFTRRWLLEHPAERQAYLPLSCALARYCFATEYALLGDEDHSALRHEPRTAPDVCLLACYEPLFRHPSAADWRFFSELPAFTSVFRAQVDEPLREQHFRATLSPSTPIADPISLAVREQYEENPYPRWASLGRRPPLPESSARLASGKRILIAGCGTGREAADAALMFPAAQVLGIDLSSASLGYGMRRAHELGLMNLSFEQADLLEFPALGRSFDLIVCSGVLHHLADTASGVRALLSMLGRGGALRVALYSSAARRKLAETRAALRSAGERGTPSEIRRFRAMIATRDESCPLKRQLEASADFYSLSGCRDLLFHAQERTFTLPEVSALTRSLGLRILRIEPQGVPKEALYRSRFPDDPSLSNLDNWERLEEEQPLLFSRMYGLWLCRGVERDIVDLDWIQSAQRG
jgi:2-polyprenyl-3-methyl-5-hydroxy-6-metoxy-1,4-benzoquinol methylase